MHCFSIYINLNIFKIPIFLQFLFSLLVVVNSELVELQFIVDGVFIVGARLRTMRCCVPRRGGAWWCTQWPGVFEIAVLEHFDTGLIYVVGVDGLKGLEASFTVILQRKIMDFIVTFWDVHVWKVKEKGEYLNAKLRKNCVNISSPRMKISQKGFNKMHFI